MYAIYQFVSHNLNGLDGPMCVCVLLPYKIISSSIESTLQHVFVIPSSEEMNFDVLRSLCVDKRKLFIIINFLILNVKYFTLNKFNYALTTKTTTMMMTTTMTMFMYLRLVQCIAVGI